MRFHVLVGAAIVVLMAALASSPSFAEESDRACDLPQAGSDEPPMRFLRASVAGREVIVAEGRIGPDTAAAFDAFLAGLETVPRDILLQSPGGRLREGLALGRAIRAAGLVTHVAETDATPCAENGTEVTVTAGACASSCAYAFLGGVERHVDGPVFGTRGSLIGYHAVTPAAGQGAIAADRLEVATREVMAEIAAYVREMGVDPRLPELAAMVEASALFVPAGAIRSVLRIETGAELAAVAEAGDPASL